MKFFIFFIFFIPFCAWAQPNKIIPEKKDITGIWVGYIKTTEKKIKYEIVISDSSGILSGYSRIIFYDKDKEFIAVKSLIITTEKDKYILEEDKLLSDNLKEEAPKKIRQINMVRLDEKPNALQLSGTFKTKSTMGLRAATGDLFLEKTPDPKQSILLTELSQMDLSKNLSFLQEKAPALVIEPVIKESVLIAAAFVTIPILPLQKISVNDTVTIRPIVYKKLAIKPIPILAKATPPPIIQPPAIVAVKTVKATAPPAVKPVVVAVPKVPVVATAAVVAAVVAPIIKKPAPIIAAGSAANLSKRSIETIQTVYFKSDSLKLTLYDNGEVDGDTVSVVLNSKVIMGKKGLSTNPITEVVYITPDMGDSLQMIMYAENLGSIAPNTGLLIVMDGKDRYEIRFSGDLNKNAAIIFKRAAIE